MGAPYGGIVRIVCVGGGPAGLYFSILMKLWSPENVVTVFERNKEGTTAGWGVTMEHKFLALLASLDAESAQEIEWRSVRWHDQVVCFGGGREVSSFNGDARGVGRQRFVDLLADRATHLGVDVRYASEVRAKSELPDADLIVAADGVNSQLRTGTQFGTAITEGRNKYIWLGTGQVFESFNFFFEPTEAGLIWAYAYQHEPRMSTFIVECAPETWSGLGFDTCSPSRTLDRLESIFAGPLAGRRLWTQFTDGTEAQWLNFRTVSNERWHRGNVVLVGDAAHTAHFSAGPGTTSALQDVIALARHLRGVSNRKGPDVGTARLRVKEALAAYQSQRQAELRAHTTEAARSAAWFENIPRYANLTPAQFAVALHARRAPILPKIPPRLFCHLHALRSRIGPTDKLRP
jgi:2-polyprenyl-6-methoxyphenol hydroxylase-like FAD-dependent oxidoreductase